MNLVCDSEELRVEKSFCLFFFSWGLDGLYKVRKVEVMEIDVSEVTFSGNNVT